MALDVNQLLADACANGFSCLPNLRSYDIVLAELLYEISESTGSGLTGVGSPENVVAGQVGQAYQDTATGNVYIFFGVPGATTGWVLVGGVVGGGAEVYYGAGADPNGIVTAVRPAIYYGADGSVWLRMTAGSNAVWEQKLA